MGRGRRGDIGTPWNSFGVTGGAGVAPGVGLPPFAVVRADVSRHAGRPYEASERAEANAAGGHTPWSSVVRGLRQISRNLPPVSAFVAVCRFLSPPVASLTPNLS